MKRLSVMFVLLLAVLSVGGVGWVVSGSSQRVISSYSTTLEGRSPEQVRNIKLAASRLNGRIVQPGEVLSFLHEVGRTDTSSGFAKAPVYRISTTEEAEAGGICQVSSTLYNAGLLAGLDIVERWPHSRPIRSVPPGLDATVATGIADLKLRNVTGMPLTVRVSSSPSLRITIVGMGQSPHNKVARRTSRSGDRLHVRVYRTGHKGAHLISTDTYRVIQTE